MGLLSRRKMLMAPAVLPFVAAEHASATSSNGESRQRSAFVLIHGAWHGGWCYARVANILRARGHNVFTPTLTGLGERSHLAHVGVNCSTHVRDVVNLIRWEQLHDVFLCGHSYGGLIAGAVADQLSDRIASIVYLDAVIPEDGASILDLMGADGILPLLRASAEYDGQLIPAPKAADFNVNVADRAMVDALCTPQPIATVTERIRLKGAHTGIRRKVYVRATGWNNASLSRFHAQTQDDPAWTTFDVNCGHDVMLDEPARLADILAQST